MISIGTFTVISIAFLCDSQILGGTIEKQAVDLTPLAATCSAETTYKVFSAVSFIKLVSAHDLEAIFEVWPSEIAAEKCYHEKLGIFKEYGFDNAEELASIAASAVLLLDEFTISLYYLIAGNTVGKFLVEKGVSNCDNVTETAIEYFENEELVFKSLDPSKLESHLTAIVLGLADFLEDFGFTAEENKINWQTLIDIFYREYSKFASYYKHANA